MRTLVQDYCSGLGLQLMGTKLAPIFYTFAIAGNPRLAAAYIRRGQFHAAQGEFDKTTADIDKALDIDPHYSAAYLRGAQLFGMQGRLDKATADFDKAIDLDPRYAAAYFGRGSYRRADRLDDAIADFDKAIDLRRRYIQAHHRRAVAYEKKGDREHAIAGYRQALVLDPNHRESRQALRRLGVAP
jgi:tetratricopeptide (TPR) repeat protein